MPSVGNASHPRVAGYGEYPVKGSVDLIIDFTNRHPGVSLLHCHLLSHEDKGKMAQILFK
jgi:FtsP/CotA-like multicopper oxidase with cupredoxin domain